MPITGLTFFKKNRTKLINKVVSANENNNSTMNNKSDRI